MNIQFGFKKNPIQPQYIPTTQYNPINYNFIARIHSVSIHSTKKYIKQKIKKTKIISPEKQWPVNKKRILTDYTLPSAWVIYYTENYQTFYNTFKNTNYTQENKNIPFSLLLSEIL